MHEVTVAETVGSMYRAIDTSFGHRSLAAIITSGQAPEIPEGAGWRPLAKLRPGGAVLVAGYGPQLEAWSSVMAASGMPWVADLIVLHDDYAPVGSQFTTVRWWCKPGSISKVEPRDRPSNVLITGHAPDDEIPLGLANFLVSGWANEGDLVLDPASRGGEVGVAAAQCGRRAIIKPAYPDNTRLRNRIDRFELEEADDVYFWVRGRVEPVHKEE